MTRLVEKFLIVRSDGECRVVARKPNLSWNELAYKLVVSVPEGWGRIAGTITVALPEPVIVEAEPIERELRLLEAGHPEEEQPDGTD